MFVCFFSLSVTAEIYVGLFFILVKNVFFKHYVNKTKIGSLDFPFFMFASVVLAHQTYHFTVDRNNNLILTTVELTHSSQLQDHCKHLMGQSELLIHNPATFHHAALLKSEALQTTPPLATVFLCSAFHCPSHSPPVLSPSHWSSEPQADLWCRKGLGISCNCSFLCGAGEV